MKFGNINERLIPHSEIRDFGVNRLKLMGFRDITDEDVNAYRSRYKDAKETVKN